MTKSILIGMALLAAAATTAEAQPYPANQVPYSPAPARPQAWSYDPYTSGMAPCPQGIHGDLETCAQRMPPTYGQPNYWPPGR
jgi:hypothetical protein